MFSKIPSFLAVLSALVKREMVTRYGLSRVGYAWAVIEPVATIALLSFIFSYYFDTPPMGESFPLFYATGLLPFMAYSDVASQTGNALSQNRTILYFPVVTPLDTILARFLLSCATVVVVSLIVFLGVLILAPSPIDIKPGLLIISLLAALMLGLGVGTVNAVAFVFFPSWRNIWSIASRPLFLISGVFFLYESVPSGVQSLLWWNPLIHITGATRVAVYPNYDAAYLALGPAFLFGVLLFIGGALALIRARSVVVESA